MPHDPTLERLLSFLQRSPTPWHATANMVTRLEQAGYRHIDETQSWSLSPGDRIVVTRNDSSIIALQLPENGLEALRMIGAHTDSPGLRLKPNAPIVGRDWMQLGVEVYGGALLAPWFDRDLGLAGRVHVRRDDGRLQGVLLNVDRPVATVPSLAIHLDREANNGRALNAQTQMAPVVMQADEDATLESLLQAWLEQQHGLGDAKVLDFELGFYDLQPQEIGISLSEEFQLDPEQSTSAIVTTHPEAAYFTV